MGVRKLFTFLQEHIDALSTNTVFPPKDNQRATVLVDGYGFLITLAIKSIALGIANSGPNHHEGDASSPDGSMPIFHDVDIIGGDAFVVEEACRRCIRRLRNELGMDLVIAVDAPRGIDGATCQRDVVWDKRQLEKQEITLHHYKYAIGQVNSKYNPRNSANIMPSLAMMCVKKVLAEFDGASDNLPSVKVVHLDAEVDELVGQLATTHKAQFILSSDTDMLVAPIGLPVVFLQHMPWETLLSVAESRTIKLPVFTRDQLLRHLALDAAASNQNPSPSSKEDADDNDAANGDDTTTATNTGGYLNQLHDNHMLFLVAASLCGNDITGAVCQLGTIDDTLEKLREVRDGTMPKKKAQRIKKLLEHPLVVDSVEQYLKCGQEGAFEGLTKLKALANEAQSPDTSATTPHPMWTRNTKEFESFLDLYQHGAIPSRFLPLMLSDLIFNGLRPYNDTVGSTLTPFHDLPTAQRVELTERALFERQRLNCGCDLNNNSHQEDGDGSDENNGEDSEDEKVALQTEDIPTRSWFDIYAHGSEDEKKQIMRKLFSVGDTTTTIPSLFQLPDDVGQAEEVSFAEGVLWTAHPAIHHEELEVLATAVMVMQLRSSDETAWRHIFSELCDAKILDERPTPRCLELTNILADAYDTVANFSKLIGGGFDDVPSPGNFFSGTLLHCLGCSNANVWNTVLPQPLQAVISDLIKKVEESSSRCWGFCHGQAPTNSRFSSNWIGVLHRDELVDMLDAGQANVEEGGRVIKGDANAERTVVEETSAPLPILEHMDTILDAIGNHNVVCIQGETGCGKSSMIPLHILLDAQRRGERVNIVVTQPRRIAATSLAERVASLLGEEVGDRVGYRIGGGAEFHKESRRTCIRFVTTGYLLESLIGGGKLWNHVTHILLDEVHERSLQADMLSLVLKLTVKSPADHKSATNIDDQHLTSTANTIQKKLVVMSATIQADMFRNYFAPLTSDDVVPTLQVGARRCKVVEYFLDEWLEKFERSLPSAVAGGVGRYITKLNGAKNAIGVRDHVVTSIADVVLSCVAAGTCILVFLPGLEEIENVLESVDVVAKRVKGLCTLKLYALHSVVDIDEQRRIVAETAPDECKVVLATNIAETSLTIPDVKVVIDVGQARRMEYDADRRIRALRCGWCSKSAAKQRAGRAGRICEGTVIKMYTKRILENVMESFDPSEFLPLEYSVLQIRQHLSAYGSITDVMSQLVEPPPTDAVEDAITRLVQWGALGSPPEHIITDSGQVALAMPVDVTLSRAILTAAAMGCAAEMTVIAAGMTSQRSFFIRPMRNFFSNDAEFLTELVACCRTIHHFDRGARSDLHAYLAAYEELGHMSGFEVMKTCRRNGYKIGTRAFSAFAKLVKELARRVLSLGIALSNDDMHRLQRIARKSSDDEQPIGRKKPNVEFPVWSSPVADHTLQLALSSISEMVGVGHRKPTKGFASKANVNGAGAPLDACGRTVLFDKVSHDIVAAGEEALKQVFETFSNGEVSVAINGTAGTVTVRFDAEKEAAQKEQARIAASLEGAKVTSIKKAGTSSAAAALAKLPPAGATASAWRDSNDNDATAQPLKRPTLHPRVPATRAHPCVHAMTMISTLHSKKETMIPIVPATLAEEDSVAFPKPAVAYTTKSVRGFREGSASSGLQFERWSMLASPADCATPDTTKNVVEAEHIVAMSVIAFNKNYSSSTNLAISTRQNMPFIATMCGSAVNKAVHTRSRLAFAVVDEHIVGINPADVNPLTNIRKKAKRDEVCYSDFGGISGFSAPLHMLLEVNIVRVLVELSRQPHEHAPEKNILLRWLHELLSDPTNATRADIANDTETAVERRVLPTLQIDLGSCGSCEVFDLHCALDDGSGKKVTDVIPESKREIWTKLSEMFSDFESENSAKKRQEEWNFRRQAAVQAVQDLQKTLDDKGRQILLDVMQSFAKKDVEWVDSGDLAVELKRAVVGLVGKSTGKAKNKHKSIVADALADGILEMRRADNSVEYRLHHQEGNTTDENDNDATCDDAKTAALHAGFCHIEGSDVEKHLHILAMSYYACVTETGRWADNSRFTQVVAETLGQELGYKPKRNVFRDLITQAVEQGVLQRSASSTHCRLTDAYREIFDSQSMSTAETPLGDVGNDELGEKEQPVVAQAPAPSILPRLAGKYACLKKKCRHTGDKWGEMTKHMEKCKIKKPNRKESEAKAEKLRAEALEAMKANEQQTVEAADPNDNDQEAAAARPEVKMDDVPPAATAVPPKPKTEQVEEFPDDLALADLSGRYACQVKNCHFTVEKWQEARVHMHKCGIIHRPDKGESEAKAQKLRAAAARMTQDGDDTNNPANSATTQQQPVEVIATPGDKPQGSDESTKPPPTDDVQYGKYACAKKGCEYTNDKWGVAIEHMQACGGGELKPVRRDCQAKAQSLKASAEAKKKPKAAASEVPPAAVAVGAIDPNDNDQITPNVAQVGSATGGSGATVTSETDLGKNPCACLMESCSQVFSKWQLTEVHMEHCGWFLAHPDKKPSIAESRAKAAKLLNKKPKKKATEDELREAVAAFLDGHEKKAKKKDKK